MRTCFKTRYVNYLSVILIFILMGFMPAKYADDFKKVKKGIDSLTVFSPIVYIVTDNNKISYVDTVLSKANGRLLDSITNALLSKKYSLERIPLLSVDFNTLSDLFGQLESSPESLNNISAQPILINQNLKCKTKYALLLVYEGIYHPDFPPHFKLHSAMVYSTVVITPGNPTKSTSDLRLLVIDTETEDIVFYDRINTSKYDARVDSDVDQMTRTILRKIYYK